MAGFGDEKGTGESRENGGGAAAVLFETISNGWQGQRQCSESPVPGVGMMSSNVPLASLKVKPPNDG